MPLRHVKQIRVVYAAFDPASVGIREFFRRVSASNILSSNPKVELDVDVTEAAKARMDTVKKLNIAIFDQHKIGDDPLFDGKAYYDSWTEGEEKLEGMRHRDTLKPHGICRILNSYGIYICVYKNGVKDGLEVLFSSSGYFLLRIR